jgi:hypothetical protein
MNPAAAPTRTLYVTAERFALVRLAPNAVVPDRVYQSVFYTISKSPNECSIVCEEHCVPEDLVADIQTGTRVEKGWRVLHLGAMDLSLTGIAAHFTGALAQAGVNVNVIATFDTDYILVQEEKLTTALKALQEAGYEIIKNG